MRTANKPETLRVRILFALEQLGHGTNVDIGRVIEYDSSKISAHLTLLFGEGIIGRKKIDDGLAGRRFLYWLLVPVPGVRQVVCKRRPVVEFVRPPRERNAIIHRDPARRINTRRLQVRNDASRADPPGSV